jgi:pyruvate-formate lyase-activating enzyme
MKKVFTYTIIAGNLACPNDCEICISKMTPSYGIGFELPNVRWDDFEVATDIAVNYSADNILITGKGEPTLFPGQITQYLFRLYKITRARNYRFNRIELQTEGSHIARGFCDEFLDVWRDIGLDLIALSIYHYDDKKNKEMFRPKQEKWFNLSELIKKLHSKGFRIRVSCLMLEGYIDSVDEVKKLISFAKRNNVFQLTLRRADRPAKPLNQVVADSVDKLRLSDTTFKEIFNFLETNGAICDILPHGAIVYEVDGQNVCLTTGLTNDAKTDERRQLIFFPPSYLTSSWENVEGSRVR